jgi:hypothetical protein
MSYLVPESEAGFSPDLPSGCPGGDVCTPEGVGEEDHIAHQLSEEHVHYLTWPQA